MDRNKTTAAYARKARYREKHREELRAKGRAYGKRRYAEDPEFAERSRQRVRDLQRSDPELMKATQRRSYAKHAEKRRAESAAYRAAYPEKVSAALKSWTARNYDRALSHSAKRRALIRNAPSVAFIDRVEIYERDNGICHICRRRVSRTRFHLDHLVPLSKGGSHVAENVAIAHPRCNLQRGDGRLPAQLRLVG